LSYGDLGITDKNADLTINQEDAKLQYPGQYYDGTDWKRTCDNVVIDFKAYTNDPAYAKYTIAGFFDQATSDTTQPLMWSHRFDGSGALDGAGTSSINIPGVAAAIDVDDDNQDHDSNYAWNSFEGDTIEESSAYWGDYADLWTSNVTKSGSNSSFNFNFGSNYQPNAAAISKITVQSMKYFPSNYYAWDSGAGTNSDTYID
jgi:hypothetical protein